MSGPSGERIEPHEEVFRVLQGRRVQCTGIVVRDGTIKAIELRLDTGRLVQIEPVDGGMVVTRAVSKADALTRTA